MTIILCGYATVTAALLPFAADPGPALPSITPAFVGVTLATELPTSFLLFARFRATGAWSTLPLGCAYLYGGAMAVLHALTFPGAVLPDRAVLGAPQSAAWGYLLWINGFAALTLAATAVECFAPGGRIGPGRAGRVASIAAAGTLAASLAIALMATGLADAMPPLMRGGEWTVLNKAMGLLAFTMLGAGIALALSRAGRRNDLFLWLAAALTALLAANLLSQAGGGRYSVGWSAGRLSWIASTSILFLFFLTEAARHARLLAAARDTLEQRVADRTAELARALAQRDRLLREVDHRAKNALAVVQSIVSLSRADAPQEFVSALNGRIAALARAHGLLAREGWTGADLGDLVAAEVTPHASLGRAEASGPPVRLAPEAVQPLALVLHELATNAVRHGAFSVPAGAVRTAWEADGGAGVLQLRWEERGGPPVAGPPPRRGFGLRLLETTVRRQLGGDLTYYWVEPGLICDLRMPLKKASQSGATTERPANQRA
ncbi:HWE histidine kinase domain-containing protein [Falsiroseomonas sp. HW251]|uniref:HWE histidine kinase domain-containing protein n=1 Tax=Falsiroseomonas sp. HW251 TaxID=3390998 RepID=UPI003D3185A7